MEKKIKEMLGAQLVGFRLPRYEEIPDVGLYLEQTTKYIADCLAPLTEASLTASMISNYVKRGLIANPVKKQYTREQIAYLIFIAVIKTVLSMEEIRLIVKIQQSSYTSQVAYDYFCMEFENILEYVFGMKPEIEQVGVSHSDEKIMLRNTIITVAHKVYLDKLFALLQKAEEEK